MTDYVVESFRYGQLMELDPSKSNDLNKIWTFLKGNFGEVSVDTVIGGIDLKNNPWIGVGKTSPMATVDEKEVSSHHFSSQKYVNILLGLMIRSKGYDLKIQEKDPMYSVRKYMTVDGILSSWVEVLLEETDLVVIDVCETVKEKVDENSACRFISNFQLNRWEASQLFMKVIDAFYWAGFDPSFAYPDSYDVRRYWETKRRSKTKTFNVQDPYMSFLLHLSLYWVRKGGGMSQLLEEVATKDYRFSEISRTTANLIRAANEEMKVNPQGMTNGLMALYSTIHRQFKEPTTRGSSPFDYYEKEKIRYTVVPPCAAAEKMTDEERQLWLSPQTFLILTDLFGDSSTVSNRLVELKTAFRTEMQFEEALSILVSKASLPGDAFPLIRKDVESKKKLSDLTALVEITQRLIREQGYNSGSISMASFQSLDFSKLMEILLLEITKRV
jgi:hypothetical protein